jgi:hypothetical protein
VKGTTALIKNINGARTVWMERKAVSSKEKKIRKNDNCAGKKITTQELFYFSHIACAEFCKRENKK